MEEKENNNKIKTLEEVVANLSSQVEENKLVYNIFAQNPQKKEKNDIVSHKINSLESEFYAPNTMDTVFSHDVMLSQKIVKLKQQIEELNHKILAEKSYENSDNVKTLMFEQTNLQHELAKAQAEYKKIPLFAKIKSRFVYAFKFLLKCLLKLNVFSNIDIATMKFEQPIWKTNMQMLDKINSEIDNLIKTNTPYGENEDRYKRLSSNLNQALKLRNSINREIK